MAWTIGGTLLIFALLECWRPCYFLTDDNLTAGFPMLTESGRALKAGRSPFVSDYLFGGHYDYLRDLSALQWHPFLLLPALLADTAARFWIIDIAALMFLLLSAAGFALLAHALREEFSIEVGNAYLVFYTLSFVFSTYVLTVGPSWVNFLGNQSALPWLALGILDRRTVRATMLVAVFTVHELLCGYPPLALTGGFCLSLFALGVAWSRGSAWPLLSWIAGNALALLAFSPLALQLLDGLHHSARNGDFPLWMLSRFSVPVDDFVFSFLMGNWTEPIARLHGEPLRAILIFPFLSTLFCCAAAWCTLPALLVPVRWRRLDIACIALIAFIALLMVRPGWLAVALYHLPFLHSMRWPFREGMLFLFFVHVLLVLHFPAGVPRLQPAIMAFSAVMFLAPLPFVQPPTFGLFAVDRQLLFSGQAEKFWSRMKVVLKPDDTIFTVIGWSYYDFHDTQIPFSLLGTYNFPAFLQVHCISGYSQTAPEDQLPIKTLPAYWFGAFRDEQVAEVFKERPDLKLIRIESTNPLKITLTTSSGTVNDLTPILQAAGITAPVASPPQSTTH